eukprot:scaffold8966_cov132-Isochrysis_galbana.AAC.3
MDGSAEELQRPLGHAPFLCESVSSRERRLWPLPAGCRCDCNIRHPTDGQPKNKTRRRGRHRQKAAGAAIVPAQALG